MNEELFLTQSEMDDIQDKIGYRFKNAELLCTAFIHSSYANENGIESYERLEFLGDSVVNLAVGEALFNKYPSGTEGYLSKTRAKIVCTDALAKAIDKLDIIKYLKTSGGALSETIRNNAHAKEDVFEALTGAILLDRGIECSKLFVTGFLAEALDVDYSQISVTDYKSAVLEHCAKAGKEAKFCCTQLENGEFESTLMVDGKPTATGIGHNKRKADQESAAVYYNNVIYN